MRLTAAAIAALVLTGCEAPPPTLSPDADIAAIVASELENPALTERLGARLSMIEGEELEAELDAAGFSGPAMSAEGCAVRAYEGDEAQRYMRDATLRITLSDCDDKDVPLRYEVMTVNFGDA